MIEIQVGGAEIAAAAKMAKLEAVLANHDPLLDEAGSFLLNRIRTRYLAELDPTDTPWIPSQAAIERRKHGGTGTLYDTGRLFHSIQLATLGDTRVISTDVPYGEKHQLGDISHGILQRMFIGFSDGDVDVLQQLLEKRLGDLIDGVMND